MSEAKRFESALHKDLGMTDAELRAELVAEGLDPVQEAQAIRTMMQRMASKHAGQAASPRQLADAGSQRFAVFHEAVSAGSPAPAGGAEAERANLMELMRIGDPAQMMWARVSGWSMRDEGIRDGDMVLVDRAREPRDGDIVLAHLAGQGQVVKRLRLAENASAQLESANPDFEPIEVKDAADLAIHGVVVGRAGRV